MSQPATQQELQRLAIPGIAKIGTNPGGLTVVTVTNRHASAVVSLRGAQVGSFKPAGQRELFWFSQSGAHYSQNTLGGGVPICWPWFSRHRGNPEFPRHGFARMADWTLESIEQGADDRTTLVFSLKPQDSTRIFWQEPFAVTYTIIIGPTLELDLCTRNTGSKPMRIQESYHTYFAVSDVGKVTLLGLKGSQFFDNTRGMNQFPQEGEVADISSEIDRVYGCNQADCTLVDPGYGRRIVIRNQGTQSTVVWNPGAIKAPSFHDFSATDWANMLCVESGSMWQDWVEIAPEDTHSLQVSYSIESLG
jgi:glucose-6-phosphate 1-epimerase